MKKLLTKKIIMALFFSVLFTFSMIHDLQAAPKKKRAASKVSTTKSNAVDGVERDEQGRRIVYKKRNVVDFDAMMLEGDVRNPNEFYFVHRPEEKFGSLVKKRPNFHKEMLRDAIMLK
jgi:hypothetical protein